MPIRRELRPFYPPSWQTLSRQVRFVRAKGLCQQCGRPHGQVVRVLPGGRWFDAARNGWRDGRGRNAPFPDLVEAIAMRSTRIVLAAAHLDHNPANNRFSNLRAFCQRCHIIHDRSYHLRQRHLTYRMRMAIGDLFEGLYRHGPDGRRIMISALPAGRSQQVGIRSRVMPTQRMLYRVQQQDAFDWAGSVPPWLAGLQIPDTDLASASPR